MTSAASVQEFIDVAEEPAVRGFFHVPAQPNGSSLLLTHGAGANCQSKLLVAVSGAFAEAGFAVLRIDLPFRQARRFGPPFPGTADRDRDGIMRGLHLLKQKTQRQIFAGGHSYGGRQTSMLVAEHPQVVDGLLLLSYPLHPPRKPGQLRTTHFPNLESPTLFVHGERDPFGSLEEMQSALALMPGRHAILETERVGHELLPKKGASNLPAEIVERFRQFVGV